MNSYVDQLTAMRMNKQTGHTNPHKALMLLAFIDLVASDDDPRNGMALCINHHWALGQELIFPCSDSLWHVRKEFDDRIDAQHPLINLDGKTILPPEQYNTPPNAMHCFGANND